MALQPCRLDRVEGRCILALFHLYAVNNQSNERAPDRSDAKYELLHTVGILTGRVRKLYKYTSQFLYAIMRVRGL